MNLLQSSNRESLSGPRYCEINVNRQLFFEKGKIFNRVAGDCDGCEEVSQ